MKIWLALILVTGVIAFPVADAADRCTSAADAATVCVDSDRGFTGLGAPVLLVHSTTATVQVPARDVALVEVAGTVRHSAFHDGFAGPGAFVDASVLAAPPGTDGRSGSATAGARVPNVEVPGVVVVCVTAHTDADPCVRERVGYARDLVA